VALAGGIAGAAAMGYGAFFAPGSQVFGPVPVRGSGTEPQVALTFDDGPNEPHTAALLDVLASRDVRATFFQVGRCVERHPESSRRVAEAGHVIGNHSYSHRLGAYLTHPSFAAEIDRTQQVLADVVGLTPRLFRAPWLHRQPALLATVRQRGMQIVSGTFGHPLEPFQPAAATLTRHAAAVTRAGSILVFHDGFDARGGNRAETVAAIGPLIDILRDRGLSFVTVDTLLGVDAYR